MPGFDLHGHVEAGRALPQPNYAPLRNKQIRDGPPRAISGVSQ